MAVTTIVLARHGETDWNRERRFQGHSDVPLNDVGRAQAEELAVSLAGEAFSTAYASPLRRALETAEILGARLGIRVQADEALKEVHVGSWAGLTVDEVAARFPDGFASWVDGRVAGWEDGETFDELGARVVTGLRAIAHRHPEEHLLVVTHGGAIRCAMAVALGLSLEQIGARIGALENCVTLRIAVREGKLEPVDTPQRRV